MLQQQRPPPCENTITETFDVALGTASTEEVAQDRKMLVVGGDDWRSGLGGGRLHNDVYSSAGVTWTVKESAVEKTKWGDPLPKVLSNQVWNELRPTVPPPIGVDYNDWIGCRASRVTFKGRTCDPSEYEIVGATEKWHPAMRCVCETVGLDPYPDSMFAPRRYHQLVPFGRRVYLLGGLARIGEDLPVDESIGGLDGYMLPPHTFNDPNSPHRRERLTMMNDVWYTSDGVLWNIAAPGCSERVPQDDFFADEGHRKHSCLTDADCFGSAVCDTSLYSKSIYINGDEFTERNTRGQCRCPMWSGRERHVAAVFPPQPEKSVSQDECPDEGHDSRIYIFGGFTYVYEQRCGNRACGGGYRHYVNDVWRTKKDCTPAQRLVDPEGCVKEGEYFAESWEQVSAAAPWLPRAGHSIVVHGGILYLMGGRTGSIDSIDNDRLLNDIWRMESSLEWVEHMAEGTAPWGPRDLFTAVSLAETPEWGPTGARTREECMSKYNFPFANCVQTRDAS